MGTITLCVRNPLCSLYRTNDFINTKVRKIILCNSISGSLFSFLTRLEACYPNCEELIIPETFFESMTDCVTPLKQTSNLLKRIIIKHSINTQPSKYGALKFALSLIVPKASISLETILPNQARIFRTLSSSNRTIKKDCYEDLLFKRIEHAETLSKIDNSFTKEVISMKGKYLKGIISNNFSEFSNIEQSLNMLEGLKRNKKLILQKIQQSIENYHALFLNDPLHQVITEKLDTCNSIIGENDLNLDESKFSQHYSELEALFHQMIETVEMKYPSKVLFNEQWFNDQIVEMYEDTHGVDEEVYEDSLIEMQKASSDLMNDDIVIEWEELEEEKDC